MALLPFKIKNLPIPKWPYNPRSKPEGHIPFTTGECQVTYALAWHVSIAFEALLSLHPLLGLGEPLKRNLMAVGRPKLRPRLRQANCAS
jgi:hypothetical protein